MAFVALPDVGHPHADGHLLGVAAALPRVLTAAERKVVFHALSLLEDRSLRLGRAGEWRLSLRGIEPVDWLRPGHCWASVTPVLLDKYPRDLHGDEARAIVATACEQVGLPRPALVVLGPLSWHQGGQTTRGYRHVAKPGKPRRPAVHVLLHFPVPVRGPVLLGAGRHQGMGLCRPLGVWCLSGANT